MSDCCATIDVMVGLQWLGIERQMFCSILNQVVSAHQKGEGTFQSIGGIKKAVDLYLVL